MRVRLYVWVRVCERVRFPTQRASSVPLSPISSSHLPARVQPEHTRGQPAGQLDPTVRSPAGVQRLVPPGSVRNVEPPSDGRLAPAGQPVSLPGLPSLPRLLCPSPHTRVAAGHIAALLRDATDQWSRPRRCRHSVPGQQLPVGTGQVVDVHVEPAHSVLNMTSSGDVINPLTAPSVLGCLYDVVDDVSSLMSSSS